MKESILNNLSNPDQLEKLYRENKSLFKREFKALYPEIREHKMAEFWQARFNYEAPELSTGASQDLPIIIFASLFSGCIAKLPAILNLSEEYFYKRHVGFIVFPVLIFYFLWKNKSSLKKTLLLTFVLFCSVVYINLLPSANPSDSLILVCIHLPLFIWVLLGISFVGDQISGTEKRLAYLRYNGDLIIMTTLLLLAGGIMTGITIGLFSLIGFNIEEFYFKYIVVMGVSASPVVATYVLQTNPQLVNKVSPVIAKIFTPLVLITLVVYLLAIFISGKDPYKDRDFLLIFNALLLGVMAIILFSLAESSGNEKNWRTVLLLFLLSTVTVIVNAIALSAILFRISEWGITPNRLAVLGGNVLFLFNLLVITFRLYKSLNKTGEIEKVENSIAAFLPIYGLWTFVVSFLFPLLFGFK